MEAENNLNDKLSGIKLKEPVQMLMVFLFNSLLEDKEFKYKNDSNLTEIIKLLEEIYIKDPQLILEVAAYANNYLNLSHFPNLLVSYASIKKFTKIELYKYFPLIIKSPNEIVEIVDLCQILANINFKTGQIKKNNILKDYSEIRKCDFFKVEKVEDIIMDNPNNNEIVVENEEERHYEQNNRGNFRGKKFRGTRNIKKSEGMVVLNQTKNNKFLPSRLILSKELCECIKYILPKFDEILYSNMYNENKRKRKLLRRKKIKKKIDKFIIKEIKLEDDDDETNLRGRGGGFKARCRRVRLSRGRAHPRSIERDDSESQEEVGNFNISSNDEDKILRPYVNLKRIIRYLKINKPRLIIDKILGKRYPKNNVAYQELYLKDKDEVEKLMATSLKFVEGLSSSRMKFEKEMNTTLWEHILERHGKKRSTWEKLIKLNIIPIEKLFQYLNTILKSNISNEMSELFLTNLSQSLENSSKITPHKLFHCLKQLKELEVKLTEQKDFIKRIYEFIGLSFKLAIDHKKKNYSKGLSLIDISPCMDLKLENFHINFKEMALLQSLLTNNDIYYFGPVSKSNLTGILKPLIDSENYTNNFDKLNGYDEPIGVPTLLPDKLIKEIVGEKTIYDYIIIFSDYLAKPRGNNFENSKEFFQQINNYRKNVNPNLRYFSMNMNYIGSTIEQETEGNNIYIEGYSDNFVTFCNEYDNHVDLIKKIKNRF